MSTIANLLSSRHEAGTPCPRRSEVEDNRAWEEQGALASAARTCTLEAAAHHTLAVGNNTRLEPEDIHSKTAG